MKIKSHLLLREKLWKHEMAFIFIMERALLIYLNSFGKILFKIHIWGKYSNFQPECSVIQYRHYINLLNNINTLPQSNLTN